MRSIVSVAVLAVALLGANGEPARAAPPAASAPLVEPERPADRGLTHMSFSKQNRIAGDLALGVLESDVNDALKQNVDDAEQGMIRAAADAIEQGIGDLGNAEHHVDYAFSGSVRETGVRVLNVSVNVTRVRPSQTMNRKEVSVEPWTPKRSSPTAKSRAEREGLGTADDSVAASTSSSAKRSGKDSGGSS
jgi:hypothetical protein